MIVMAAIIPETGSSGKQSEPLGLTVHSHDCQYLNIRIR